MAIRIISDSTCDLSKDLLDRYDITIVPLTVSLGARSGHDGADITPEDIYAYVSASGDLPKTSAVGVGEYEKIFRSMRDAGDEVIHISISAGFSSSFQNACTAAEEIGGVTVVDSRNLSTGQGLLVLHAAEMARSGASVSEIIRSCEAVIPRIEASFVVDSIDYLRKGGRCSALSAFGAGLLHIKPCIEVLDGGMKPGKKYHGKLSHVIRMYAEDRLKGRNDIDTGRIFVTHTRCDPETVEQVKDLIRTYCPDCGEIIETAAGATITTHCGPGTLGILFIRK